MNKGLVCLMTLVVYSAIISGAIGTEFLTVKGLDNCERKVVSDIGGIAASPGYIFLVTGLEISYEGSSEVGVSIDPDYFSLSLGNVNFPSSGATNYLDNIELAPLPPVTLKNGGSIRGYIAYEVPSDISDKSFTIEYSGWEDVKINYSCD